LSSLDEMAVGHHHGGAPTIRMPTTIFTISYHRQQGWNEFPRSAVREGDFCLNSLKIERVKWAVQHTAIYTKKVS
jgi:hypothetical protein